MFLSHRDLQATPVKRRLYLAASTVVGILLFLLAHFGIEALYLRSASEEQRVVHWAWGCALHPAVQFTLLLLGPIGGFLLGRFWWRMLYIEHRWTKR